jgi:hypothetical protein
MSDAKGHSMNIINKSNWITGALIFFMPVLLIFFLGSQMAYGQVKGQFDQYRAIPQAHTLAELAVLPAGQTVLVQGVIAVVPPANPAGLLIYQVRPVAGREVRFQEEFPLVFPAFTLTMPDGVLPVEPSLTRERVIQHEQHAETAGETRRTGFKPGNTVLVQGTWQAGALVEATGLTGASRAALLAEWEQSFRWLGWARNGLGLLTVAGLVLLGRQVRRAKRNDITGGEQPLWRNAKI